MCELDHLGHIFAVEVYPIDNMVSLFSRRFVPYKWLFK